MKILNRAMTFAIMLFAIASYAIPSDRIPSDEIPNDALTNESIDFEAHEHGNAEITIAIDEKTLEIEFKSPSMNIVGFEYQAKSNKERAAVYAAQQVLKQPENLFGFTDGQCVFTHMSIDLSSIMPDEHEHEEKHEHEKAIDPHFSHSDVIGRYSYQCEKVGALSVMAVKIFEKFSGVNQIHAMWITNNNQGGNILNVGNNSIHFKSY